MKPIDWTRITGPRLGAWLNARSDWQVLRWPLAAVAVLWLLCLLVRRYLP